MGPFGFSFILVVCCIVDGKVELTGVLKHKLGIK